MPKRPIVILMILFFFPFMIYSSNCAQLTQEFFFSSPTLPYGKFETTRTERPQIALVLSGGGARGFAHIPIIEAIEEVGIPIDLVVGTSMGSLVGGLYAAGYSPADMRRLVETLDMITLFSLSAVPKNRLEKRPLRVWRHNVFELDFDATGIGNTGALIGDQRILCLLSASFSRVVSLTDFDQLAIPFRCVGTDIITGEAIIFDSGSLVDAIRGSISIPGVFTFYPVGDRFVVDGGLVDNLPVMVAKNLGADIVIAVDVNAVDYDVSIEDISSLSGMLMHILTLVTKNTVVPQLSEVDILIAPDLSGYGVLDFLSVREILQVGEEAKAASLASLQELALIIAEERPLVSISSTRYGPYFSLPDIYISSVSHRALAGSESHRYPFDIEPFEQFVGKPLDAQQKRILNELFESLRESESYATIGFSLTDLCVRNGATYGNLEIQTRTFQRKNTTVRGGLFGSISYTTVDTPSNRRLFLLPEFSFSYEQSSVANLPVDLIIRLTNDDALTTSMGVSTYYVEDWAIHGNITYSTGGIHLSNIRNSLRSVAVRDRKVGGELSLWYTPDQHFFGSFGCSIQALWYGDSTVIPTSEWFVKPFIEGIYCTRNFGFFLSEGIRTEGRVSMTIAERGIGLRLSGGASYGFPLGSGMCVGEIVFDSSRSPISERSSFADYGGYRGFPTYPSLTLVQDMILAKVTYQHSFMRTPFPFFLQGGLSVGSKSDNNGNLIFSTSYPFGLLQKVEASASIALGVSTQMGDIIIGCAVDSHARISLFLEVL